MKTNLYKARDSVLVRTPLFSSCDAQELTNGTILDDSRFRTALAVASPSLSQQVLAGKQSKEIKLALLKYVKRMTFRPTPYALLAGVGLAKFGDRTELTRDRNIKICARPDMSLIMDMVGKLEQNRNIRSRLTLFSNPQLISKAGRLWLEQPLFPHKGLKTGLSLAESPALTRALSLAAEGCSFVALCETLSYEFEQSYSNAENLVHQLCDFGMLFSHLRFSLDNSEKLLGYLRELDTLEEARRIYELFESLIQALEDWDPSSVDAVDQYMALLKQATSLAQTKEAIQVDSAFGMSVASVSYRIAEVAEEAVEILLRVGTIRYSDALSFYCNSFKERYQDGREIPLLELLSPTFGIGFPHAIHQFPRAESDGKRDSKLHELALRSTVNGCREVVLTDKDLTDLQLWKPEVLEAPLSVDLFFSIFSESPAAIDNEDFSLVIAPRVGEIGAGRTLGRFCSVLGNDAEINIKEIACLEQDVASEIHADVSFWTENPRSANIAMVPGFRNYVITANCAPSNAATSIPLSELVIGLEDDKFYARWIRTGQKVVAYSNNMLNKMHMPEPINFLLTIATHGQPKIESFEWGYTATRFQFLPRLRYGKIILSPASWDLKNLHFSYVERVEDFKVLVRQWRDEFRVPAQIQIAQGRYTDNLMLLDLENDLDLELLEQMIRTDKDTDLIAYEFIGSSLCLDGDGKSYETEFVTSLLRRDLVDTSARSIAAHVEPNPIVSKRDYLRPPGTEWLYLRLDCSARSHEELIVEAQKMADTLIDEGCLQQWFFVRFSDPADHLRLRFKVDQSKLYSHALPALFKWASSLVESALCYQFSLETYDREIERYGGKAAIDLIEEIFSVDSRLVANILRIPELRKLNRKVIGVMSINHLLIAFKPTPLQRYQWLKSFDFESKSTDSQEYRALKPLFREIFDVDSKTENALLYSPIDAVFEQSKDLITSLAARLYELEKYGHLTQTVDTILFSLVHMHCIRFLGIDRVSEQILKSLLMRCLDMSIKSRNNLVSDNSSELIIVAVP